MERSVQERVDGLLQFLGGSALFSLKWWSPVLDQVVSGAHAVASITGAILGIYGLWKLVRRKRRRNLGSGDAYGS